MSILVDILCFFSFYFVFFFNLATLPSASPALDSYSPFSTKQPERTHGNSLVSTLLGALQGLPSCPGIGSKPSEWHTKPSAPWTPARSQRHLPLSPPTLTMAPAYETSCHHLHMSRAFTPTPISVQKALKERKASHQTQPTPLLANLFLTCPLSLPQAKQNAL